MIHFMEDTVDKRQDAHSQRHLGALFQLATLVFLHAQSGLCHLFVLLLQQIVERMVFFLFLIQLVEKPEEEEQQDNSAKDGPRHEVQLMDGIVQDTCTRLQLPILTGLLLQVDIDITVIVAVGLVIDCRISHTELFADTGYQVGSLIDARVDKCTVQIEQGTLVVLHSMIARSQRTIGTCYLIDVAIVFEQLQSLLSLLQIGGVIGQCLLSLCLEISIAIALGHTQATVQAFYLLLMNLLRGAIGKYSACTDVVEIVQVLGRVVAHLIRIQLLKGLHTLAFQSYIIIIGGSDNSHFRFRISQSLALTLSKLVALFVDAR